MARTVSDFLVDRLVEWGVRRVFGYPGDGINGLLSACQRRQRELDFVQVRHEEMAAFMACGHAKFSGGVGVCLATSGPGAIHLLNGLYDAKCDHQPVVAIVGQQPRAALGGHQQQEVDLASLFKDVAGAYCHMVTTAAQLPNVVDRAVRIALAERTVTCLIVPSDVQREPAVEVTPHEAKFVPGGLGYRAPRVLPHEGELRRAAAVLNQGQRVAMLVGQGARGAKGELLEVADRLGAGVAKALLGKDVLPDDLPFVTGAIGLLGTRPSTELMRGCDTLFMVGSSFPYSEYLPQWGQARGVQLDLSGAMIGIPHPPSPPLIATNGQDLPVRPGRRRHPAPPGATARELRRQAACIRVRHAGRRLLRLRARVPGGGAVALRDRVPEARRRVGEREGAVPRARPGLPEQGPSRAARLPRGPGAG